MNEFHIVLTSDAIIFKTEFGQISMGQKITWCKDDPCLKEICKKLDISLDKVVRRLNNNG